MGQVAATFTGIALAKSAVVPRSLGFMPNPMVLVALPQATTVPAGGVLVLQHGATTLTINDVKVDFVSLHLTTAGHMMIIRLLDRRWRWKYFPVSGRYNVYLADGTIDPSTQQSVQDLASILLDSMFETSYDVSVLPTDVYPEVEWSYDRADIELSRMLERMGCDICLNLDDTVSVVQLGVGAALPVTTDLQDANLTVDPPEGPDKLLLVCGETQFQSRLKLVAVGLDTDGSIKKIDDLSYKPSGGWQISDDKFFEQMRSEGKTETEISLAKLCVYRWYQVEKQADGTLNIPGYGPIADIKQILPLNDWTLDTYTSAVGDRQTNSPAQVYGTFLVSADPNDDHNSDDCTLYEGKFSIDRFDGIVKFSQRVMSLDGSNKLQAATLYLSTSYGIRADTTLEQIRATYEFDFSGGDLTEVIRVEEIALKVKATYSPGVCTSVSNVTDNSDALADEANRILGLAANRYTTAVYASGKYRGLIPIAPGGCIRQVVFTADDTRGANTQASYNTETATHVLRSPQRRRRRIAEENSDVDTRKHRERKRRDRGLDR